MDNSVYIWNTALNQYATYVNGVATNGGSRYIASGQSFFVKANAASPVLSISEGAKTTSAATFKNAENLAVLTLHLQGNHQTDQTAIVWNADASHQFESWADACKLRSPVQEALYLVSVSSDQYDLAVNALNRSAGKTLIRLKAEVPTDGTYQIKPEGLNAFAGGACVSMTNEADGRVYELKDQEAVTLTLQGGQTYYFNINVGTPVIASIQDATCQGLSDGSATVSANEEGTWSLTWKNEQGEIIHQSKQQSMSTTLTNLAPGQYTIEVAENGVCSSTQVSFTVDAPQALEVFSNLIAPSCVNMADGNIEVITIGGEGNYDVEWNDGKVGAERNNVAQGTYQAHITDDMGCQINYTLELTAEDPYTVSIESTQNEFVIGEGTTTIQFTSSAPDAAENKWFVNGEMVEQNAPVLEFAFQQAGTYEVELQSSNDNCFSRNTKTIVVKKEERDYQKSVSAFWNDQGVMIDFAFYTDRNVQVKVYDVLGQQVAPMQRGTYANARLQVDVPTTAQSLLVEVRDTESGESKTIHVVKSR
jgi:hypothetical protein